MEGKKLNRKLKVFFSLCLGLLASMLMLQGKAAYGSTTLPSNLKTIDLFLADNPTASLSKLQMNTTDPILAYDYGFIPQLYPETNLIYVRNSVETSLPLTSTTYTRRTNVTVTAAMLGEDKTYFYADYVGVYKGKRVAMKVIPMAAMTNVHFGTSLFDPANSSRAGYSWMSTGGSSTAYLSGYPKFRYCFYDADTDQPLQVSGFLTSIDIDGYEYNGADNDDTHAYVTSTSGLRATIGAGTTYPNTPNFLYLATRGTTTDVSVLDKNYWVTRTFSNVDTLDVEFNANATSGNSVLPISLVAIEHPEPSKTAEVDGDTIHYSVYQYLSPRFDYQADSQLVFEDTLSEALKIVGASSVTVENAAGTDITNQFTVEIVNQTVKLSANSSFLNGSTSGFGVVSTFGQQIKVTIQAELDRTKDLTSFYDEHTKSIVVTNQASFTSDSGTKDSNTVTSEFPYQPTTIQLEKKTDKTTVTLNDMFSYSIKATKADECGEVLAMVINDTLPAELAVVADSTKYKFENDNQWTDLADHQVWTVQEFSWTVPEDLNQATGEYVEVVFQVTLKKWPDTPQLLNKATITGTDFVTKVPLEAEGETAISISEAPLLLNIRLVAVDSNAAIVSPTRGYGQLKEIDALGDEAALYNVSFNAGTDAALAFTKYQLVVNQKLPTYQLVPTLPQYYSYQGYGISDEQVAHKYEERVQTDIQFTADETYLNTEKEVWITIFIKPQADLPGLYSSDYKTNDFGTIRIP